MRIRISHELAFSYAPPARTVIQMLRLTPRGCEAQHVLRWRIATDLDCALRQSEDSLGNIVHSFSFAGPIERIRVSAEGEVETFDTLGVVRGAVEPLLAEMYLRAAPLAQASGALADFARGAMGDDGDALERLHRLMDAIAGAVAFDPTPTPAAMTAAEAFSIRKGGGRDFAHIFIACARWAGIPARFVSGYLAPPDVAGTQAGHAWAEAHVPVLGWIAFDAANDTCADPNYVRVAVGFDAQGAAPSRSARAGLGGETLTVALRVGPGQSPTQRQIQG